MRAIVKTIPGMGNIAVQEVQEPFPKENEVKIKIAYAGICGTDVTVYSGAKQVQTPLIMGHEFSGVITQIGKNVTGWKEGDRVIAETTKESCEHCFFCRTGQHSLCLERKAFGQQLDGVFADYICQKTEFLHRIPEGVSLMEAALVEPAACAYHAIFDRSSFMPTDRTLIIGPGPMGLLALQMLKSMNVYTVVVGIEVDVKRLHLAEKLGADETAIISEAGIGEVVKKYTNGKGFDYALECAGFEDCIENAIKAVRTGGRIIQIGIPNNNGVSIKSFSKVMLKELSVIGTVSHRYWNWAKTLKLVEDKKLNLKPLISHHFMLQDAKEAFEATDKIKVLFDIHPEIDF